MYTAAYTGTVRVLYLNVCWGYLLVCVCVCVCVLLAMNIWWSFCIEC